MIGTISIECNAKNPNMPLHPLRAYVNSPSSLRITNVPKKIGKWSITKVTFTAIYPDNTTKSVDCVLTGGVWVGTIAGSTVAGTYAQGYTILADGTDENGNAVTGYVLGKGDVVIMQSDGVPEPEPATIFVKLQADGTDVEDGDMYPTENGYMIQQNGEAHQVGTPFDQITAYVDTQVSSKADLSAVPTKTSDLSNDSGFITASEITNKRDLDDFTIKGNPQGAGSWFVMDRIIDSETVRLTLTYNNGVWDDDIGYTPYEIRAEQNGYGLYSFGDKLFSFSLGSDFSFVTQDGQYTIIGYNDTIAKTSELPTKTSDLSNDSGFITTSEVSALNTSPASDVKVCIDSNGDLVEKKLIDQTGVWYVKGIYNGTTQIYDFWTPMPTLNGTILSGLIQDKAGEYLPVQWSTEVSETTTEKTFDFVYHGRGIRIQVKKSEAYQIPFEIETGRISLAYNHYPILSVSQLSNDSGFITSADIHNDYIEDINGSSISADRSFVTVTQLSGVWQLQYGVTTNTLCGQSKTNMSYYPSEPELGGNAFQLTWGIHSTEYWTLEVYTYNGDWSHVEQYNSEAATSAETELVFPDTSVRECVYEESQIVETGKLAAQDWVQAEISSKQDKLSNTQLSAIDFAVNVDSTVVEYLSGGVSSYMIVGGMTPIDIPNIQNAINIKIGKSVTGINQEVFFGCNNLTSITIPNSVTSIGDTSFSGCAGLSSIVIPDSVVSIGYSAFQECTNLTGIVIGENVTTIGSGAFYGCTNLTNVIFSGKTLSEVQSMQRYPWGISDTSIIKTWNDASQEWVEDKIWYDNTSVVNSQNVVYLEDRAVQAVNLTSDSTVMVLPALVNGKTNDFVLDVCNTNQDSQEEGLSAVFSLSGTIGTDFSILVPEGESFVDMTTLEYDEFAEFYFTKTAFQLSSLPTWKVVKQKVEPYIPETI